MKFKQRPVAVNTRTTNILVVDDEAIIQKLFVQILEQEGYIVETASTGEQAQKCLAKDKYNLLLLDKNLPDISGIDLIPIARELQPQLEIIIITGFASYESVVTALRQGVYDYIEKPFADISIVLEKVRRALEKQNLCFENRILAAHLSSAGDSITKYEAKLAESIGDMDKIELYVNEMAKRVALDIREENMRLKSAIQRAAKLINKLQSALKETEDNTDDAPPSLHEASKLARYAWSALGQDDPLSVSTGHPSDDQS